MLQNRVDPKGMAIKTPARGQWMGNRGVIHNNKQQIIRPFNLHAWITCRLAYKNQQLPLMDRNHNTQLFFMDEATALSAGHRPCAFCRRDDYNRFKSFWLKGNPATGFTRATTIKPIDDFIHAERINKDGTKITHTTQPGKLPDGSFILLNDLPFLLYKEQLYLWSPFGYEKPIQISMTQEVTVLTPASIINTIAAGYLPQIGTGIRKCHV